MKIGIVTFHNVYNYGGMLQAYALCQFINQKYSNCYCIDYQQEALTRKYRHQLWDPEKPSVQNVKHFITYYILRRNYKKEQKFNAFLKHYIPLTSAVHHIGEFRAVSASFDILVSGSDQLWNPQFTGGQLDPVYFLDTNHSPRKFAYASSAGARDFNALELEQLKQYLDSYQAVAVREEYLRQQLNPIKQDVQVVLDPTLLLSKNDWLSIREPVSGLPQEFILLYTFDNDSKTIAIAHRIARELSLPIVSLFKVKTKLPIQYTLADLGPAEFLDVLDKCRFVVSNSFHGTAFAINFQKDFYSVYKPSNPHRVLNLVKKLSLENRVINSIQDLPQVSKWGIDYSIPMAALEKERTLADNFLTFQYDGDLQQA